MAGIFKMERKRKRDVFIKLNEVGHSKFVSLPRRRIRHSFVRLRRIF